VEKFQEIVGGADHGPRGRYFLDAAQQELAEAACLFDLSEHRFHHLLSRRRADRARWRRGMKTTNPVDAAAREVANRVRIIRG
jgi:hypothetical protein